MLKVYVQQRLEAFRNGSSKTRSEKDIYRIVG